jgi:ribose transport system ATP-binding protein
MNAVLETSRLSKVFGSFKALDEVSIRIESGRIQALIGENGAGKSTLIRLLSGVSQPTSGSILLDGREVRFASPGAAARFGIGVVYQERHLIPGFSVAENIYLGEMPRSRFGLLNYSAANRGAAEELHRIDVNLDPKIDVSRLSAAQQQIVEIARGARSARRILILDEPTASLTPNEAEHLFDLMRRLAAQSFAVVFVSHKIEEIYAVCDSVTVLRDGRVVQSNRPLAELSEEALIEAMVGRKVTLTHQSRRREHSSPPRVELADVSTAWGHRGVNLALFAGEIHGLYGLVGSGRTELAKTILGEIAVTGGTMSVQGVRRQPAGFAAAVAEFGIGYVSEDRKGEGLALSLSILSNAAAAAWRRIARFFGFITTGAERTASAGALRGLSLSARSLDSPVSALSGGNQQKVSVAKWLVAGSDILIFDEPTIGVDLPSKQALHEHIRSLAERGKTILVITSDLLELVALADRISVMANRQISDCFENTGNYSTTAARIMATIQAGVQSADHVT